MLISVRPHTFNYNITVKINNGPIKNFFYKDDFYFERSFIVKEGVKGLIKSLYNRNFNLKISFFSNIEYNNGKCKGVELINTGFLLIDFKIKNNIHYKQRNILC